jgi:hypothetical protein
MPNAMKCGCSYELFMHLSPRKLEVFYETHRLKAKEQLANFDNLAWMIGSYVRTAIVSSLSDKTSYPEYPLSVEQTNNTVENNNKNETMSDGQKFALFMVKHNKARKNKA